MQAVKLTLQRFLILLRIFSQDTGEGKQIKYKTVYIYYRIYANRKLIMGNSESWDYGLFLFSLLYFLYFSKL